jgi:hypothetical protein
MVHKQCKPTVEQGTPDLNNFEMIEAMGLKEVASRYP